MNIENIRKVIIDRLVQNGKSLSDDFVFGEFVNRPNVRGTFFFENNWFIFESDEKNVMSISGPFNAEEIVYAIALLLHESKLFEDYKFGSEALQKYIHNHFRNMEEVRIYLD